jgi:hypothetical protein
MLRWAPAASLATTPTPTGSWEVVWRVHGMGDGEAAGPLPDGALMRWSWQPDAVGAGCLALREGDGAKLADRPGVSGACPPLSRSGRPGAAHGLTLGLGVTADTAWSSAIEVWTP